MSDYTSNFSKSLKTSALLTLFLLSSVPAFAVQVDNQEDVSTTPSIQPSNVPSVQPAESDGEDLSTPLPSVVPSIQPEESDPSIPLSAIPSPHAVNPEVRKLEEELKIAQLKRQLAEEEAARLIAQQYTSPPSSPVDPFALLARGFLQAVADGRSDSRVQRNMSTELTRGQESLNNFLNGQGWNHNKRINKKEMKRQERAAKTKMPSSQPTSASSPSVAVPSASHEAETSTISRMKKASQSRADLSENNGIMTVTTDNSQKWMHQVATDRFPVNPGDLLQVSYNITATEGGMISFDLLNTKKAWYFKGAKRVILTKGDQTGIIEYEVPEGEREASLVFYNDKASLTPTTFTINSLKIAKASK